jgi:RNA polymerase sigma factor (TIGR02999 family)
MDTSDRITDRPTAARSGEASALDRGFPLVYDELHRLAHRQLRGEATGHTLSTTALVHEAYLRLAKVSSSDWKDEGRGRFLALAATAMRRILVDEARRRRAVKRGGGARRVTLADLTAPTFDERVDVLLVVDDALASLAKVDARQARVVECRFFGGFTEDETADALGVGLRTVKRDWAKAKAWLHETLGQALGA